MITKPNRIVKIQDTTVSIVFAQYRNHSAPVRVREILKDVYMRQHKS